MRRAMEHVWKEWIQVCNSRILFILVCMYSQFYFILYVYFSADVADEEAIVNYYGPATVPGNAFQTSTAFAPYPSGLKKTEKVWTSIVYGELFFRQ